MTQYYINPPGGAITSTVSFCLQTVGFSHLCFLKMKKKNPFCPTNPHVNNVLLFGQVKEDAGEIACRVRLCMQTSTLGHAVILELRCNALFSLLLAEEQAKGLEPHSPLQPLDGQLLPRHAVLRPLRLLPLSPVQHHLQLLEN